MSSNTYKLAKNTYSRINVELSEIARQKYFNKILSSWTEIPQGVIVTIEKDNLNCFDISYREKISYICEESNYIFQNPYNPKYYTARIIKFDFDEKIFDSEQNLGFKYWFELFNTLTKLNEGAIYLTICIDDYIKI